MPSASDRPEQPQAKVSDQPIGEPLGDATLVPTTVEGGHPADSAGPQAGSSFSTRIEPAAADTASSCDTILPAAGGVAAGEFASDGQRFAAGAAMRFKILRPHAQGGLGKVSVARDQELNRDVALKEIRFQYADDESARARFIMEAEVTGGLEHPSIVPVYGLGCFSDGRPYYAMRFIKGHSLKEVVDRFHQAGISGSDVNHERTIELRRLLQRFIDVCQAIEYAHSRGVIHRDIKPGNIMLGDYGETLVVDWGLAKPLGQKEVSLSPRPVAGASSTDSLIPASGSSVEPTQMGSTIGTLQFMGPEQAAGRVDLIGPPADIYSLGATLYYILTGRPSVSGKTTGEVLKAVQAGDISPPSSIARGIPKSLDAVCRKAMALKPEDRYDSARAFAKDLERWLADEPVSVYHESRSDRIGRWLRRNQAWFRAVTLATVVVIIVLSVAVVLINGQRHLAEQQRQLAENLAAEKTELANRETDLRRKAQWQAASRSFEQSLLHCEQLDPAVGVLSLTRSLAEAQAIDATDLELSVRAQLGRWEGAVHTLQAITEYPDSIRELLQSPDGSQMLVATNGATSLLDLTTKKVVGEPLSHDQRVSSMAFYSDGKQFVTASEDKTIRFWNAASAEQIGDAVAVDEAIVDLSLSTDQRHLATCTGSQIRLWDVASRRPTELTLEHPAAITAIEFCPNSSLLLASDWDAKVHVWDIESKQRVGAAWEHGSPVLDIAISPDGTLAAACELSNVARVWEISSGKPVGLPLVHYGMIGHAHFSPDGKRLVTGCADQSTRLWDVASGVLVGSLLRHPLIINTAIFDRQGEFVWTGCGDRGLRQWRVANGRSQSLPLGSNGNVIAARIDDREKSVQMISASIVAGDFVLPGELRQWNFPSGSPLGTPIASKRWGDLAAFAHNGQRFVTATGDNAMQVWDSVTCEPIGPEIQFAATPKSVAFSHDDKMLLIGTQAGEIRLWNLDTGESMGTSIQLNSRVSSAAFFPANERFIVGCWDQAARIYDLDQIAAGPVVVPHESLVVTVGVNSAGTQYFTSAADGGIRLWDAQTHQRIGSVMNHASRTKYATFTPDGGAILASYLDGSTRLWDVRTFDEIGPPLWHAKEVTALAQSGDGQWAATASTDWTGKLWNIGPASGTYDALRRRYEAFAGMQQAADGALQALSIEQWRERMQPPEG